MATLKKHKTMENQLTISKSTNRLGNMTKWVWYIFVAIYSLALILLPLQALKDPSPQNIVQPLFESMILGTVGAVILVFLFIRVSYSLSKIHSKLKMFLTHDISKRKYIINYYLQVIVLILIMLILIISGTFLLIPLFLIPVVYVALTFRYTLINER